MTNNNEFNLSDQDLQEIIKKIAKPSFNYFLKRLQKEVFDKKHSNMPLNYLVTIVVMALSNSNGNIIRWIEEFYKSKTGQNPGTNIRMHFLKSLQDHFSLEVKGTLQ